jgi:hypothetical protein
MLQDFLIQFQIRVGNDKVPSDALTNRARFTHNTICSDIKDSNGIIINFQCAPNPIKGKYVTIQNYQLIPNPTSKYDKALRETWNLPKLT